MKNILVAGYPKSGNTWIGYLLSRYFNARYYDAHFEESALSGHMALDDERYTSYNQDFSGNLARSGQEAPVRGVIKTHARPGQMPAKHRLFLERQQFCDDEPLVVIMRDPRDVSVSYFYYNYFRVPFTQGHWSTRLPYAWRDAYYRRFHFEEHAMKIAAEWAEFYGEWLERKPLVVRYEDLLTDPVAELERVSAHVGGLFQREHAEEAREFCAIANLRSREYKNDVKANKNERFFRSGKAGDWEGYYSAHLLARLREVTRGLPGQFGY